MEDIRLLARRRVCSRLSSGRFPSATIELSVRSMASCWSYGRYETCFRNTKKRMKGSIHLGHAKVFDGRDFIACEPVCERRDEIYD